MTRTLGLPFHLSPSISRVREAGSLAAQKLPSGATVSPQRQPSLHRPAA